MQLLATAMTPTGRSRNVVFTGLRRAPSRIRTRRTAMDEELLRVEVTCADRITEVSVTGEVDAASMLTLQGPLSGLSPQSHIFLDMSGVGFMDCSGLRVILAQRIRMSEAGGSIHIRHASLPVQRLLQVSGLADIFSESDTPL